jgi:hypothetical protein
MELLDRYLQAVKKHLPVRRQDDIIAELRANLESQLEDKEAELGRPLTNAEAEDWLRTLGPPMMVAARYQPQQYLIGPTIFPMYWFVLRTVFLWATVVYSIVSGVVLVFQPWHQNSVIEAVLRIPGILVNSAVCVTLVFAAIEFAMTRFPDKISPMKGCLTQEWSPSSLPPLEKAPLTGRKRHSFAQAVAEVIFGFFLLVWLLLIPKSPFLLLGPGVVYLEVAPFQLADVWVTFYWLIVGLSILQFCWKIADLVRGTWQQSGRLQRIVFSAFWLVPLILLLNARDQIYVTLKNPSVDPLRNGATVANINHWIHIGLLVVCAIAVLQLIWDVAQIVRAASRADAAEQ